jgi:hypothetical protein
MDKPKGRFVMAAYVKFELEDGTIVYIESTDTPKSSSGLLPPSRVADHTAEANQSFEKTIIGIQKMAAALVQNLRAGFTEQPTELSVSFGLKASADLGNLIVSRGGLEANYNVSLRWHKDEASQDDDKESKSTGKQKQKTE